MTGRSGSDRGAVVMLDPRTGEVLALASTPTYDASAIADPATRRGDASRRSSDDPAQPLLPRATQGRYVPGSVFKIVTAVAGLGSGAITPSTTYKQQPEAEKDGLLVDGFRIRDGHHPATGSTALDFVDATEVSCNICFALTGLADRRRRPASTTPTRMGFGAPIAVRPADGGLAGHRTAAGQQPGGFARRRRARQRRLRPGRDVRDAAPDGARRGDGRQRRRADAAAARHGARPANERAPRRSARSRWRRVIDRRATPRRSTRAMVAGGRGRPRAAVHHRREGARRHDRRQVGHGRAGRDGRAALVVHRLRARRGTRRSRSRSSSSRPAGAARSRRRSRAS